jgi:hypothetical protein
MSDPHIEVLNTHTAAVADVPPGKRGRVPLWVAEGPLRAYLKPTEPSIPPEPVPAPPPPPIPPVPPVPPVPVEDGAETVSAREARELIRKAESLEDLSPWLHDPRSSVRDAAMAKARRLEGLDDDGDE